VQRAAPTENTNSPAVSVIIATYNRSQVLRHAIESVCNSSWLDWELIVVGDACTDDTAECVASFRNPRITFFNLPVRYGHQAGPNNKGVALARGKYIAFLNHDDFFFPEHLEKCVHALEAHGADLVWSASALAKEAAHTDQRLSFSLIGITSNHRYSPFAMCIASCWLFRRELFDRVGQWRSSDELYVTPSQDWLFRAWRSGAVLRFVPIVSVIVVLAGPRPGSYSRRKSPDHELIAKWLREDPKCRERILEEAAVNEAMNHFRLHRTPPLGSLRRMLTRPVYSLLAWAGIHPLSIPIAIRFGKRGNVVRNHRRITGVD
jgi:glycosyltransferase involved in cell wall biosynthesis